VRLYNNQLTGAGADQCDKRFSGAPFNDDNGENSGHARVFEYDGSNWNKIGEDIDGEAEGDQSGISVTMNANGDRVIIGGSFNDDNGIDLGHARVLEYDGYNWTRVGPDIDGEAAGDRFGFSVAITADGSRVIIGAVGNDGNGIGSGHARVLEYDGFNWNRVGPDIDGEAEGDISGISVAIRADGNRVIIGARGNDDNGIDSGHARVFDLVDAAWIPTGLAIDGEAAGDSARAVAISAEGFHCHWCSK
jgi:hypothetical protein